MAANGPISDLVARVRMQHDMIAPILERFFESLGREDVSEVRNAFMLVSLYIETHFITEEKLMRASRYPGAAGHLAAHKVVTDELEALRDAFSHEVEYDVIIKRMLTHTFDFSNVDSRRDDENLLAHANHVAALFEDETRPSYSVAMRPACPPRADVG